MLEVLRQNGIAELLGLLDCEAIAFLGPGHDVLGQRIVDNFEEFD